jgi:hypothetical protein
MYDIFAQVEGRPRRPSADDVPNEVLREKFIASVVEVLQEINQASVINHNITIKSAIISRPEWLGTEEVDMIDEACLLAGIEVFERQVAALTWPQRPLKIQDPMTRFWSYS